MDVDLCLKGSQINLNTRQSCRLRNSNTLLIHQRPQSANLPQRRYCHALRVKRPKSAEFDLNAAYKSEFAHLKLNKKYQKRYQSVSSNNLLKLLLDEPIKRSWLCGNRKDISSSSSYLNVPFRRNCSWNNCKKIKRKPKLMGSCNAIADTSECEDNKHNCKRHLYNDLPGRVSFSKFHQTTNELLSDLDNSSDNDTESSVNHVGEESNISAPGPFTVDLYSLKPPTPESTSCKDPSLQSVKKFVHFGGLKNEGDVLSQTYEYHKCPSDASSGASNSSSNGQKTASATLMHTCNPLDCKCLQHEKTFVLNEKSDKLQKTEKKEAVNANKDQSVKETSNYNAILQILEKIQDTKDVEQKNTSELNNHQMSSRFSDITDLNNGKKEQKLNNLIKSNVSLNDTEKTNNTSDTTAVINNCLNVVTTSTTMKKKVNVPKRRTYSSNDHAVNQKFPTETNNSNPSKSNQISPFNQNNVKKPKCPNGSLDDTHLHEFNIDKVDSWMSAYDNNFQIKSANDEKSDLKEAQQSEQFEDCDKISILSGENFPDDSTYDEIVSIIKEIEDDKKKDDLLNGVNGEFDFRLDLKSSMGTPESFQPVANPDPINAKVSDKYQDIFSYLDNVEDSCEKTLLETRRSIPESNRSEIEFVVEPDIVEDVPKISELLMLPNHQLARRVVALSLRANELANALVLSREQANKIRSENQKVNRVEKANASERLKDQKKHYEGIVKRHQGFIEQLLKDKGSLCEKVTALTRRLESQNQAWEHKLQTEITRVKENCLASEKIRRERWVRENTKKIKELTVKGIEMEINKMTTDHQREVTELKTQYQQQLLDALDEARIKHEHAENSIREACAQDREALISKERNAIRERFEKQLLEERNSFDEQKQYLQVESQQEKQRLINDLKNKETQMEIKYAEWQREQEANLQQTIADMKDKMSKQEESYQNRVAIVEKQYESDFELWKKEYENLCKMQQVEKENAIRQHYHIERDRQIDAIVKRMDTEALQANEEYDLKISRLKEKYDKDLMELESVEKSLRAKYTETRSKLAESDAEVRNVRAENKQLQIELEHSKKMCNEFLNEREQLREQIKNEFHKEMQTMRTERDQEIQQIHKRIQHAVEKKDATIELVQKENGVLRERCLKLEAVIRQQRKDYCVK